MRVCQPAQTKFGEKNIADISIGITSRDDVPQILFALQYLYLTEQKREQVFELLNTHIQPGVSKTAGCPGMNLWNIFVMGIFRLSMNGDYDRLHEQVNHHDTIRQMLGHWDIFDKYYYHLQTVKGHVRWLPPELFDKINQIVVTMGHDLVRKNTQHKLRGRCDSFVVEINVHYPTDISL